MLRKYLSIFIAGGCIFLFILLSLFSSAGFSWNNLKYSGHAITADEITYIPSGYYALKTGRAFFNIEHPPLIKDIAALPLFFLQSKLIPIKENIDTETFKKFTYPFPEDVVFPKIFELENSQWRWGTLFLFSNLNNVDSILFWSRLAIILFNALLLGVLFFSLKYVWSSRSALLALVCIVFSPIILAFAPLVILDLTTALLQLLALVWFAIFLQAFHSGVGHKRAFLLAGLFILLANLAKATSLFLYPVLGIVGFSWLLYQRSTNKSILIYILYYGSMVGVVTLTTVTYYLIHTYNMQTFEVAHQINTLLKDFSVPGKQILLTFNSLHKIFQAFAEYLLTIILNIRRVEFAVQRTYFLGTLYRSEGPGLLYYPILLFTKLQLPLLFMGMVSIVYGLKNFLYTHRQLISTNSSFLKHPLSLLLLSYSMLYFLCSWVSNLQMGIRYILIVVLALVLFIARTFDVWWKVFLYKKVTFKHVFIGSFIFIIFSTLQTFPYFLSYYNILGGGTKQGHFIAVDSNYDWGGQDVKRLAQWVKEQNVQTLYADLFAAVPEYYLGNTYKRYSVEKDNIPPPHSYVVISAHVYQMHSANPKVRPILKNHFPLDSRITTIGSTMFVFKTPDIITSTPFFK